MSLVSYACTDSEGSEDEESSEDISENVKTPSPVTNGMKEPLNQSPPATNVDPSEPVEVPRNEEGPLLVKSHTWKLPPPKKSLEETIDDESFSEKGPTSSSQVNNSSDTVHTLNLPSPKHSFVNVDWKDILAARSKFQPIKISVPAMPQATDEEEVMRKKKELKRNHSNTSSGLFALLPQPKHEGIVITSSSSSSDSAVVSNTPTISTTTTVKRKKLSEEQVKKLMADKKLKGDPVKPLSGVSLKEGGDEGNASDEDAPDSFFFTKTDDVPVMPIDDEFLEPVTPAVPSSTSVEFQPVATNASGETYRTEFIPEHEDSYIDETPLPLDESALRVLCGGSAKRKKNDFDAMEVIDVSGDSLRGDANLMIMKGLTEEYRPSRLNSKKLVSSTSARKHQITYLAAQAKELEFELKRQWGANRLTKKQTQSKYGF